jgi:hypothetical protein
MLIFGKVSKENQEITAGITITGNERNMPIALFSLA